LHTQPCFFVAIFIQIKRPSNCTQKDGRFNERGIEK